MKQRKITDKYLLLIPEFKNKILRLDAQEDDVIKFRISKDGNIVRYRKNAKDLDRVKKRIKEDFYNYDEFIRTVLEAILEDLHL